MTPRAHGARWSLQRRLILVMIVIVLGTAGLVLYAGARYGGGLPATAEPSRQIVPTEHPPTGRRWFWDRSLWQNPEPAAP